MIVVIHLLPTQMNFKAFSSVFTPEIDVDTCQLPDDNTGIVGMVAINRDESVIMSKLSKLNVNKSAGPDDIYPRIVFEAKAQLVHPLLILFDISLSCGFERKAQDVITSPTVRLIFLKSHIRS